MPADKVNKDKEPAYCTAAPIQNPKVAEEVYERSMKAPFVTLSPAELLALSPDYCQKLRDSVTPKRIFPADGKSDQPIATHLYEEALPFADTNIQCYAMSQNEKAIPPALAAGLVFTDDKATLPALTAKQVFADGIIIPDPYETYCKTLPPGKKSKELFVAKESHAL